MRLSLNWLKVVAIEEMDHELTHVCLEGGHRLHVHQNYESVLARWRAAIPEIPSLSPATEALLADDVVMRSTNG